MKRCPYCAEEIQDEAVKCRYCASFLPGGRHTREWYRKRQGAILGGVCSGLADLFGVSPTALRLAAVLLTLLGFGWGIVIYLVLWVVMPYENGKGRIWAGRWGRYRSRRRGRGRYRRRPRSQRDDEYSGYEEYDEEGDERR